MWERRLRAGLASRRPRSTRMGPPARRAGSTVTRRRGKMQTLMVADKSGVFRASLPPATYTLQAGLLGYALGRPARVALADASAHPSLKLADAQAHRAASRTRSARRSGR